MKRVFADLHLCPNLKGSEQVERMTRKASELGYRLIAMPLPPNFSEEKIRWLRNLCNEACLDFASRVDLKPQTSRELINSLRKLRRRFEILSVMCESKDVARQAAKDRRVDLLNFPSLDFRNRFFDKSEAELASNALASLEIDVNPLLTLGGPPRIRLLSSLRRETATAQDFHVPIVISSGVSDELLMRKPKELAALASLYDLNEAFATEAVSKNPTTIVKRNREKLSARYVAPGMRVIRMGKDCQKR
jgi:RNase P/RNase MRP subunit p30